MPNLFLLSIRILNISEYTTIKNKQTCDWSAGRAFGPVGDVKCVDPYTRTFSSSSDKKVSSITMESTAVDSSISEFSFSH